MMTHHFRQWRHNRRFKQIVRHQLRELDNTEIPDEAAISGLELDFLFSPDAEEGEDEEDLAPEGAHPPISIFGIGLSAYAFGPMFSWWSGVLHNQ